MDRTKSKPDGQRQNASVYKKLFAAFLVTASVAELPGCGTMQVAQDSYRYNSAWNSFVMKHRNQGLASKAWHRRKHHFCNEEHLDCLCDGFRAGYMSVAEGGDGCTPAFPPREYWGWEYQSAEGQRKVSSWFAGYPLGCKAAEEDGVGNWSQIQTSYGIQREYHQAGLLAPNQAPGMYPMPEAVPAGQAYLEQQSATAARAGESILNNAAPPVDNALPLNNNVETVSPAVPVPGDGSSNSSYQSIPGRIVR